MRAVLIDPIEKRIEEIDVVSPNKSLQEFYDIIGTDIVELVFISKHIVMIIDEVGRCKDIKGAFKFFGVDDLVIAGKAVIMEDVNGKFRALHEDVNTFKKIIEWVKPEDVPEPEIKIISF